MAAEYERFLWSLERITCEYNMHSRSTIAHKQFFYVPNIWAILTKVLTTMRRRNKTFMDVLWKRARNAGRVAGRARIRHRHRLRRMRPKIQGAVLSLIGTALRDVKAACTYLNCCCCPRQQRHNHTNVWEDAHTTLTYSITHANC